MKIIPTIIIALLIIGCKSYAPTYDMGKYPVTLLGSSYSPEGTLIVKVNARGQNLKEVKYNALKSAISEILLNGVSQGCADCIKPPIFQNMQNTQAVKNFMADFFANPENVNKYAKIYRDIDSWENKRDLKYTQNLLIKYEVQVNYLELLNLKKQINNEQAHY